MNHVGKNAIKMGCIQVLPGKEFRVVKALKKACQKIEGTKSIIFKGLGFYDIFLFYESEDFKSRLTPAGTIPGIINSNTYLCFPYLKSEACSIFKNLSDTTFVGLSLLKFNQHSTLRLHDIERLLVNYLNEKIPGNWNALGTLGWNEVILLVSLNDFQSIINILLDLNYKFGQKDQKSDFILKTFSYVGINHDRLPVFEQGTADDKKMENLLRKNNSLNSNIPKDIIPSINISSQPIFYSEIKKYWSDKGFVPIDSLGNFDIIVKPKTVKGYTSWAQFLALLLCFRIEFQTRINSTSTKISTTESRETGFKINSGPQDSIGNSVPIKEELRINIQYDKFKKIFGSNTNSLINHFYTLNSAIQNPISGHAFLDMMEYIRFLEKHGKTFIEEKIGARTMDKLYLNLKEVIRSGTSLRSYGISNDQERVHGHFSEIRGGAQRALLAMEFIPEHVFYRLKSKWYGFINVEDPKFAHFNQIIICPTQTLWEPEQWWALYHEIGHILLEQVPWSKNDNSEISSFLLNMPSPQIWHHFIIELYAEVIGYILGFFSNFDLYLEVLWEHLINIEPSQREFTPLWPYILRSYFVKLYEDCFRKKSISEDNFQDEEWLYTGLLEHINNIHKIIEDARDWPENDKLFLSANHCQTIKELFPLAKHLYLELKKEEDQKDISFSPPDGVNSIGNRNVLDTIMGGKIYLDKIENPESLLFQIVLNRKKMNFQRRMAAVLTFWNMSNELLKG